MCRTTSSPGGGPPGGGVLAPLNRAIALFRQQGLPILASRDWLRPIIVLSSPGVERLFIGGLANGYDMSALAELIRTVNVQPDGGERAREEMRGGGAEFIESSEIEV